MHPAAPSEICTAGAAAAIAHSWDSSEDAGGGNQPHPLIEWRRPKALPARHELKRSRQAMNDGAAIVCALLLECLPYLNNPSF